MAGIIKRLRSTLSDSRVTHTPANTDQARSIRRVRLMADLMVGPDAPITEADTEHYLSYMNAGDPPADALAEWMSEVGFRQGMATFEKALENGIDTVKDAPACMRAFFKAVEEIPAWLDEEQIALGQRAINRAGMAVPYVLGEIFLLGGYGISAAMNQALVMTGGLREGSTLKRTMETSAWWLDVTREGGLGRHEKGFITTVRVRLLHAIVRRKLSADSKWDHDTHGLPINQAHMAATGHAFGAGCLITCRSLGVRFTPKEREAFIHLWQYANHIMGVTPELNASSERAGMRLIMLAALTAPAENELGPQLAKSYVDQVRYQFPKLGLPGKVASRVIANGCRGLAWLGLGRDAYRKLGLPEKRAWVPLTFAAIGVLNTREILRGIAPATNDWFTTTGRRLQELQINLMRDPNEQPDQFIPYDERETSASKRNRTAAVAA